MVGVAQVVRAPVCGTGCRGFESLYPPLGVSVGEIPSGARPPVRGCAPVAQLDRATDFESVGRRFESCRAYDSMYGPLAQLVEQQTLNLWVAGSIPARLKRRGHGTLADPRVPLSTPHGVDALGCDHYTCESGGIGRHARLRIWCRRGMRVRVPSLAECCDGLNEGEVRE
jgi:hypothetical protein